MTCNEWECMPYINQTSVVSDVTWKQRSSMSVFLHSTGMNLFKLGWCTRTFTNTNTEKALLFLCNCTTKVQVKYDMGLLAVMRAYLQSINLKNWVDWSQNFQCNLEYECDSWVWWCYGRYFWQLSWQLSNLCIIVKYLNKVCVSMC